MKQKFSARHSVRFDYHKQRNVRNNRLANINTIKKLLSALLGRNLNLKMCPYQMSRFMGKLKTEAFRMERTYNLLRTEWI